jgi:hypothetical protein
VAGQLKEAAEAEQNILKAVTGMFLQARKVPGSVQGFHRGRQVDYQNRPVKGRAAASQHNNIAGM